MNIFILGNSGHLLHLPKQENWQSGVVIATNRILRDSIDGRVFNPDILVISDGRVWESEQERIRSRSDVSLFLPHWMSVDYNCFRFNSGTASRRDTVRPIQRFPSHLSDYVHAINSVAFQAAQIAYALSRKGDSLYLLGVDAVWPSRGDSRRNEHHFYDDRSLKLSLRPFQTEPKFNIQWKALSDHCYRTGRQLFNCSPWDDLALTGIPKADVPVR